MPARPGRASRIARPRSVQPSSSRRQPLTKNGAAGGIPPNCGRLDGWKVGRLRYSVPGMVDFAPAAGTGFLNHCLIWHARQGITADGLFPCLPSLPSIQPPNLPQFWGIPVPLALRCSVVGRNSVINNETRMRPALRRDLLLLPKSAILTNVTLHALLWLFLARVRAVHTNGGCIHTQVMA
jgi:hypothetical protein